MEPIVYLLIGICLGSTLGYLVAQRMVSSERTKAVSLETQLDEARKRIAEAGQLEERFREAFKSLANDALRESRQDFLGAAKETLGKVIEESKGDIGKRKQEIDGLISPIKEALDKVREANESMDRRRHLAYGTLTEQLKSLTVTQEKLRTEAGNLVSALRRPNVRGQWGEITLRNLIESAGLSSFCDFVEQPTSDGRGRPDMLVRLPGGHHVVVDSKCPLDKYLDAIEESDEARSRVLMEAHAKQVRTHCTDLSRKAYHDQFQTAPDYVIMFIAVESVYSAALEIDRTLMEDAFAKRIILACPTTLVATLRTIGHMWRQEELAVNAQRISEAGKELHERVTKWTEHMDGIRKGLDGAVKAYNSSVGSLEQRVLPAARKLKELGVSGDELPLMEPVQMTLRMAEGAEERAVVRMPAAGGH